ncbi:MAG TPA: CBS domain-containing protein [Candidatus Korarchaeota archaeon]|nr:CBS domain-containing protein [Candidatus Korarchaeota archaeon]
MDKARDYMVTEVATVYPNDTISHARNLMLERGVKRLLVVDKEGKLVGILTLRDIVRILSSRRVPWKWRSLEDSLIGTYMTKDPVTVTPDTTIYEAAKLMIELGISGLPVVRSNSLVGLLTKTDLIRYFAEKMGGVFSVRDLMKKDVITVRETDNVKKAAKIMMEKGVKRLIVTDSARKILGIVTETDLAYVGAIWSKKRIVIETLAGREVRRVKAKTVREIMKTPVVTVKPKDDAAKAARMMLEFGFSGFPVSSDGEKLKGLITKTDVIKGIIIAKKKGFS